MLCDAQRMPIRTGSQTTFATVGRGHYCIGSRLVIRIYINSLWQCDAIDLGQHWTRKGSSPARRPKQCWMLDPMRNVQNLNWRTILLNHENVAEISSAKWRSFVTGLHVIYNHNIPLLLHWDYNVNLYLLRVHYVHLTIGHIDVLWSVFEH